MEEIQHPKGCCVKLGNWPIEVQLGSTNSKGLPVRFQGSYQGCLLNNQLIYGGSHGHAHGPFLIIVNPPPHRIQCHQTKRTRHPVPMKPTTSTAVALPTNQSHDERASPTLRQADCQLNSRSQIN